MDGAAPPGMHMPLPLPLRLRLLESDMYFEMGDATTIAERMQIGLTRMEDKRDDDDTDDDGPIVIGALRHHLRALSIASGAARRVLRARGADDEDGQLNGVEYDDDDDEGAAAPAAAAQATVPVASDSDEPNPAAGTAVAAAAQDADRDAEAAAAAPSAGAQAGDGGAQLQLQAGTGAFDAWWDQFEPPPASAGPRARAVWSVTEDQRALHGLLRRVQGLIVRWQAALRQQGPHECAAALEAEASSRCPSRSTRHWARNHDKAQSPVAPGKNNRRRIEESSAQAGAPCRSPDHEAAPDTTRRDAKRAVRRIPMLNKLNARTLDSATAAPHSSPQHDHHQPTTQRPQITHP